MRLTAQSVKTSQGCEALGGHCPVFGQRSDAYGPVSAGTGERYNSAEVRIPPIASTPLGSPMPAFGAGGRVAGIADLRVERSALERPNRVKPGSGEDRYRI
jgi:hypothetical protein